MKSGFCIIFGLAFTMSMFLTNCGDDESESLNMFTDPRDDQTYRTVMIGDQTWMKENLNYITGNSWCYDEILENCVKYGRLYDWQTAKTGCPVGWHLPSKDEMTEMVDHLGGEVVAGGKLKEAGLDHWLAPNSNATDETGFTGLPGGTRLINDGNFIYIGEDGYFWSSTEGILENTAWRLSLNYNVGSAGINSRVNGDGLSVRCVKD